MDTVVVLLVIIIVLAIINIIINIIFFLLKKVEIDIAPQMKEVSDSILQFKTTLELIQKGIKDEFVTNRDESNKTAKENREEMAKSLKSFEGNFSENINQLNKLLREQFEDLNKHQNEINRQVTDNIKDVRSTIEKQLRDIREDNNKQLDEMRQTVDEKLQKTLNERLSRSFETVSKQLQSVQEGLGEMKNLAQDVGGLKKVLSNVKLRGGIGEVQLEALLEQILAPEQYEKDVATKAGSRDNVEFAIKLPGKDDDGNPVWLPVDAKFPSETFEHLQDAYESEDLDKISNARKNLVNTIKKMAKDINEKYIDPPNTTDFAIMFLPFEAIYAEVVRDSGLFQELQNTYKVIVMGPTTLAAILNSLQLGFKTLAIGKRSSEVWRILAAVKQEFGKFGNILSTAKQHIETGLGQIDKVITTRTNVINKKLKDVENISDEDSRKIFSEFNEYDTLSENSDDD